MNMKPCCKILLPGKSTRFLGSFPSPQLSSSQFRICGFDGASLRRYSLFRSVSNQSQKQFNAGVPIGGKSRGFSTGCSCDLNKGVNYTVPSVASDFKSFSTSVESRGNDKNFERIYVQGGLNAKPAVAERGDLNENVVKKEENRVEAENYCNGVKDESAVVSKEEPEIEKEAWRLLRNAVVTYCGSPLGTLAANDPNDKVPLNYDQVFIRDFVPSAFAFLLKGEGEIVRNFLLHTLQLQVT